MDARLAEGLPSFASQVWDFPEDREFLNWLFVDAPDTTMLVAHDDGRWLACLGVFERIYEYEGGRLPCLETYGWASLETNQVKGLGIRCMKTAINLGKPLVALGGSRFTEEYMPRLGFSTLAWAPSLTLPFSGAEFGGNSAKQQLIRLGLNLIGPFLKPGSQPANGLRHVPTAMFDEATLALTTLGGFQATFRQSFFEWQNRYGDAGMFLPFRFMREGELVGWVFARVAEERPGIIIGRILECKLGLSTTPADHVAMLRIVTGSLAGFGAAGVRALTTCPETVTALKRLRFISGRQSPAMVYLNGLDLDGQPIRVSVLRADGGVLPLPSRADLFQRHGRV